MAEARVFAQLKAKAGKEQAMREVLLDLVKATRTEDGVDFYELFETTDGGEFFFNEKYASKDDFEAHKSSDHFKSAVAAIEPLRDGELSAWVVDPVEPVL